jgi:predicted hydrolase (HD superfamily)
MPSLPQTTNYLNPALNPRARHKKDKAFARTVNRNDLWQGAEELGVSFDEHCAFVIAALREIQAEIGLSQS